MTSPDFWSQVSAQRGEQQPTAPVDMLLWRLIRRDQRAEAYVRVVRSVGVELRFLLNGELRRSQLCRDNDERQAISIRHARRTRGWKDPNMLAFSS